MGRYTIYLAQHGWAATGIDSVERALRVARQRASDRGVAAEFVHGDVTRLDHAGISGPFDLLLDSGCFHGMPDKDRHRYGESLTRVAAPASELLMFAFGHRRLLPSSRGAEREDIERTFSPAWTIVWSGPDYDVPRPPPGGRSPTWYRLQRTGSPLQRDVSAVHSA
jgi:ubiquinone/menaquinone biosynthesis C-methylase UbiE